mgnify:CR=1 FL=1
MRLTHCDNGSLGTKKGEMCMITEKDYLKEPCSTMITPFYMARRTAIRKDMLIVADSKYNETLYRELPLVGMRRCNHPGPLFHYHHFQ